MNLHYFKTSKEDWSCYQCMYHKAFQLHFIISRPFFQKKHIDYHTCANLFNYPAILHLFSPSKRHLKLLPAQNARKYTTPKHPWLRSARSQRFATLWIYTTPKPQKRTEAATSAYITRLFNYILSYHFLFCQERIILIVTTSKKDLNACVRYL